MRQASGYRCLNCGDDRLADVIAHDQKTGVPTVLRCLNCGTTFTTDWN